MRFAGIIIATFGIASPLLLMTGACQPPSNSAGTPVARTWEVPDKAPLEPQTRPETVPPLSANGAGEDTKVDLIAQVNGRPITRARLTALLYECHGLSLLEHLILLEAAKQRAAEMSLEVTNQDITAAHREALKRLASGFERQGQEVSDTAAAEQMLNEFLTAKNISRREWQLRMEERAYLAKIAEAEVNQMTVTEQMLRDEHEHLYGQKVQIRHIQLPSLAAVARARALLAEKKDFELVARQLSENDLTASQGGLLPPFTRSDPAVPPLIRDAAFSMEPGQVSAGLHEQDTYHIILVERKIPPSDVGFDQADKDALRTGLLERLRQQRQETLEAEIFNAVAVKIEDRAIEHAFRKKHRQRAAGAGNGN